MTPCGYRQRRVSATQCATCPQYTRVSNDGRLCVSCPSTQIALVDGTCKTCPTGQILKDDGRTCYKVCGVREMRVSDTECKPCDPYTRLSDDKKSCVGCPKGWIASPMGVCSQCPNGFTTADQKTCYRAITCPPYTKQSKDGSRCETCPIDQIAMPDGRCQACGPGMQTTDQRKCVKMPCKASEIRNKNGNCVCPEYTTRQRNGECRKSYCHYRQILLVTGVC